MLGNIVLITMFSAIVIGIVSSIISTDPAFQYVPATCANPACSYNTTLCPGTEICAPVPKTYLNNISSVVTIIFIVDYFTRIITVWAVNSQEAGILPWGWEDKHHPGSSVPLPVYSLPVHYIRFVFAFRNLVDLAAIVPFFIRLVRPDLVINNNFVRVLRLVRVLGIMNRQKEVKIMLQMIVTTMERSSYALCVLLLLSLVFVIFYGSVMFALESGKFVVDDDFPTGSFVRDGYNPSDGTITQMASPFNSIGVTMYYVITTITTVGYGDLFPTTFAGRICANIIMYTGIIGLALPIGVISSNFADVYREIFENGQRAAMDQEDAKEAANLEKGKELSPVAADDNNSRMKNSVIQISVKSVALDRQASPGDKELYQPVQDEDNHDIPLVSLPVKTEALPQPGISVELMRAKIAKMKDIRRRWEMTMKDIEKLLL